VSLAELLDFMENLPEDLQSTADNRINQERRNHQCPEYDMEFNKCSEVNTLTSDKKPDLGAKARFDRLDKARKEAKCKPVLRHNSSGMIEVYIPELDTSYHPYHVECTFCKEYIIDHLVFTLNGNTYCERHWAETEKESTRRCLTCDEIVFAGEVTKIQESPDKPAEYYHKEHFTCSVCEKHLGGMQYFRDPVGNQPICGDCMADQNAKCPACGKPCISGNFYDLGEAGTWHAECYKCWDCPAGTDPVVGIAIAPDDGKPYCPNHFAAHANGIDQQAKKADEDAAAKKAADDAAAASHHAAYAAASAAEASKKEDAAPLPTKHAKATAKDAEEAPACSCVLT